MDAMQHVNARISVLFVTTGLFIGGAETMLYRLLSRMDRSRYSLKVISLIGLGPIGERIQRLGIPVESLGMRNGRPDPMSLLRLVQWLRRDKPDVLQTWMCHADLIGGLAAKLAGGIPVAWGIRQSELSAEGEKPLTLLTVGVCAKLSRWLPSRIVCCSEASRRVHAKLGYAEDKMMVIPNGSDLESYKPDPDARASMRREWGVLEDAIIIGLVARFHPQKDFRNFVRAAGCLSRVRSNVYFTLCGGNVTSDNPELMRWIDEEGLRDRCILLGRRDDISRVTAAFDIATSASFYGEGFPNVVTEAMSCGVPCVVTDVGDSALIVGETGLVVPPRDHGALARAWDNMIELGPHARRALGIAARKRVMENFELSKITARYQNLFSEMATGSESK